MIFASSGSQVSVLPASYGRHLDAVRRHVVGQHAALAVEDQAAPRHHRPQLDAVGFRARGVLGVLPAPAGGSTTAPGPASASSTQVKAIADAPAELVGFGCGVLQVRGDAGRIVSAPASGPGAASPGPRTAAATAACRPAAPARTSRGSVGSPSARWIAAVTMRSLSSSPPIASACCDIGKKRRRARKRCRMKAITTRRSACSPSRLPKTRSASRPTQEGEAQADAVRLLDHPVRQHQRQPVRTQRLQHRRQRQQAEQQRDDQAHAAGPSAHATRLIGAPRRCGVAASAGSAGWSPAAARPATGRFRCERRLAGRCGRCRLRRCRLGRCGGLAVASVAAPVPAQPQPAWSPWRRRHWPAGSNRPAPVPAAPAPTAAPARRGRDRAAPPGVTSPIRNARLSSGRSG